MRSFLTLAVAAVAAIAAPAHADLVPGDVVILGFNSDAPDQFAWAPLVNLSAGTQITFTDKGVLENGSLRSGEGSVVFTAPAGGISQGTILTFSATAPGADYAGLSASFNLAATGDQLLAYSGLESNPTYLFIAQSNSTQFQVESNDSNQSDLPTGLQVGQTAVAAGAGAGAESEYDNIVYNYSLTTGTRAEILAAVGNQANWIGDDDIIGSLTGSPPNSSFTVLAAVPEPSGFLFGSLVAGVVGATARRRRRRAR